MLNIFQLADNDQSLFYLGQLFGNVGFALTGTGPALLATMFKVFNTALLAVGALMVTYITVVGVLATAQEGEFLGKKWHALWVPLRTLGGIAALFPTASGYCVMQVIVMWIVVQGIGMADMVWKQTVIYLGKGGATNTWTRNALPGAETDPVQAIPTLVQQIFANAACQSALLKLTTNNANAVARSAPKENGYNFGIPDNWGVCGMVGWKSGSGDMQDAQKKALQTLVPVVEVLANQFVKLVVEDKNCWVPCEQGLGMLMCPIFNKYKEPRFGKDKIPPDNCILNQNNAPAAWQTILKYAGSNFMIDATKLIYGYANNYMVEAAMKPEKLEINGNTTIVNLADQSYVRAQTNGWIFAGAYYNYIAHQNSQIKGNNFVFINSFQKAAPARPWDKYKILSDNQIQTYYDQAFIVGNLAKSGMQTAIAQSGGSFAVQAPEVTTYVENEGGGSVSAMSWASHNFITDWTYKIGGSPNNTENPIINIQGFGENLLNGADVLFWTLFGTVIGLGALSTQVTALGTTVNYASGVANAVLQFLYMPMIALLGYLISMGGILGVYTPMIPYIYFTFGAIGWMLAVVDAMVAAPLIALGILSPSGQHEILGRAEPAVMILLNILLRPTLMVFGMMAGMLLSFVVVKFINAGFYNVVASILRGGNMGMIEGFLFIMVYAGMVLTALNKCFSLIYLLPDQLLRWIGGHGEAFGEKAAESGAGEAKSMASTGGKEMGGALPSAKTTGALAKSGREFDAARQEKKKVEAESAPDAAPPPPPPSNAPDAK